MCEATTFVHDADGIEDNANCSQEAEFVLTNDAGPVLTEHFACGKHLADMFVQRNIDVARVEALV